MASTHNRNDESEEEEVSDTAGILSTTDPLLRDPSSYTITAVPRRHDSPPPTEVNLFKEEPPEDEMDGSMPVAIVPMLRRADVEGGGKRRKRACNSEFYDVNDSASSSFAPVAPIAPQGLVPVWTVGAPLNSGIHGGGFFMIPQSGLSSAHQLWAIPAGATTVFARPISSFVSAVQPATSSGGEGKPGNVSTTMAPSSSSVATAQMLRDFSLEVYDKRELQFMVGSSTDQNSGF
ncbi:hypothetical protein L1987_24125 [Smallanthus sonchifolius]|uniref:Uncharacterized protein n=1 Tax=Smallanthus sonchifolius TaxID=185202 RepID=A0ACB9IIU9_9ASTR|nr:hypothetical protein L1987_24125 [Smallanthus sonchifolius]